MPRLLILADLHYRQPWFDWLATAAPDFDAVVLPGDLVYDSAINGPSKHLPDWSEGRTPSLRLQADQVGTRLTDRAPRFLAACSGNHDSRDLFTKYLAGPAACVDGETKPLPASNLVFTAIAYDLGRDRSSSSATLDAGWPASPPDASAFWVLLHHVPPAGTRLCPVGQGQPALADRLRNVEARQPDLVCCGHFHPSPRDKDGAWCERLGHSWVLNPGSLDSNKATETFPVPPHIIADTTARTLTWHSGVPDAAPVIQSLDKPLDA